MQHIQYVLVPVDKNVPRRAMLVPAVRPGLQMPFVSAHRTPCIVPTYPPFQYRPDGRRLLYAPMPRVPMAAMGGRPARHMRVTNALRPKPDPYKTALCRNYQLTGECNFGPNCVFAHGFDELRRPHFNVACKYGANCRYGNRCQYDHGDGGPYSGQYSGPYGSPYGGHYDSRAPLAVSNTFPADRGAQTDNISICKLTATIRDASIPGTERQVTYATKTLTKTTSTSVERFTSQIEVHETKETVQPSETVSIINTLIANIRATFTSGAIRDDNNNPSISEFGEVDDGSVEMSPAPEEEDEKISVEEI